jgi:hypothetical protein
MFPSITEYNRTIQNRGSDAFVHENDLIFIPSRTLPIKIYTFGSGAYAVVFKANQLQRTFAFRCYLSTAEDTISRSKLIYEYLRSLALPWKVDCSFLDNEMIVNDVTFPVVKMEWIEGLLINQFVSKYIDDTLVLAKLQQQLVAISASLELNHIGHGDIQSGNVIVQGDNHNFKVKLIDYDGIYIPALANKKNLEKGRSEFQHPGRHESFYNERIDRFSFWVIITAIEALKYDKSLWIEEMQGGFNTLDNFLFKGSDFQAFNQSNLVKRLYDLNQPSLSFFLDKMNIFCYSKIENVIAPQLYDDDKHASLGHLPLPIITNKSDLISITSYPASAVVLSSTFHRLGITPLMLPKKDFVGKTIIISLNSEIQKLVVDELSDELHTKFEKSPESHVTLKQHPVIPQNQSIDYKNSQIIAEIKKEVEAKVVNVNDEAWYNKYAVHILVLIIITALVAWGMSYEKKEQNYSTFDFSADTSEDTSLTDSTSIVTDTMAYDPIVRDTIITDAVATNETSYSNAKDSSQETSTESVIGFFNALNSGDYTTAWSRTYNPSWEAKGEDWFVSADGYGSVTKVNIYKSHETTSDDGYSEVYVFYYAEGANDSHSCYTQSFELKMFTLNERVQWLITGVKNLEAPYMCAPSE